MKISPSVNIIAKHIWQNPKLLVWGAVGIVGGTAINLLLPQGVRLLVSPEYFPYVLHNPWHITALVLACLAIQGSFFYVRSYAFLRLGQRVTATLREKLFINLLNRPLSFFEENKSSDLVSRIIADLSSVQDVLSFKLSVVARYLLQAIVGFALMLWISPILTLWMLLGLPPLILFAMLLGKKLKAASRSVQEELGKQSTLATEALGNMRVVRTFAFGEYLNKAFLDLSIAWQKQARHRATISAFFSSFVNFLLVSLLASGILYGLHLVSSGDLTAADFTAFLLYGMIVGVSFAFLSGAIAEFSQAIGSAERALELATDFIPSDANAIPARQPAAAISIRNVSFSYPTRPQEKALKNISFEIEAGSSVAFVGPSGAGKSTLALLLLKLFEPTSGEILYNNKRSPDIRFAYVPQEPELFGLSLAENLRVGNQTATDSELNNILQQVGLTPWLQGLQQGLHTKLGERGLQVSGGQRQRLAIARALLREPSLLVLDEPTAALDSETESIISKLLAGLHGKTTIVTIAHRLSTIQNADSIYVLQNGEVIQTGSHGKLSQETGLYRRLTELSALA